MAHVCDSGFPFAAGTLVKEARSCKSTIIVEKNGAEANTLKRMTLMRLGVKCGDVVAVRGEGEAAHKGIHTILVAGKAFLGHPGQSHDFIVFTGITNYSLFSQKKP